jgi:hypothetical protein
MAARAMTLEQAEMRAHCAGGHRSKLVLNKKLCHGCITASMRGPAGYQGGGDKARPLNAIGADTVDYGTEDICLTEFLFAELPSKSFMAVKILYGSRNMEG